MNTLYPRACSRCQAGSQGRGKHGGSYLEDLFVGTAAHYSPDRSCWLQIDRVPGSWWEISGQKLLTSPSVQNRTLNHILAGGSILP